MNRPAGGDSHLLTHRLASGLQVVGEMLPDRDAVAAGLFVRTGARDEQDAALSGISHFLEHMVFKGTQTPGWQQLKQEFTRIGAEKNGFTPVEWTYYLRVQHEYLERAVRLPGEMMTPRLDERDLEQEKGLILNEFARAAERVVTAYEPPQPTSEVFVRQHLKQQTVLLSMPTIASNDPDYHAANLASSMLGHADGSRLYWNIR